jgi:hypothetical protein
VGSVTHAASGRREDGSACGGRVEGAAEVRVLQVACGRRHRYAVYACSCKRDLLTPLKRPTNASKEAY